MTTSKMNMCLLRWRTVSSDPQKMPKIRNELSIASSFATSSLMFFVLFYIVIFLIRIYFLVFVMMDIIFSVVVACSLSIRCDCLPLLLMCVFK